jgi:hypothetical protein
MTQSRHVSRASDDAGDFSLGPDDAAYAGRFDPTTSITRIYDYPD